MILLPFWTSILVKSFAFTVLLGNHGILNSLLMMAGLEGLPLLFNRFGVVLGLSHWLVPFAVFPILSNLVAQPAVLRDAARIMGAQPLAIFMKITLPQSLPAVFAAYLMTTVISLGSFVTPALLGGRRDRMLANLVDFYVREALNWERAAAIAVILLVFAVAILSLSARRLKNMI
jgi:putative spermidine/putrescine transport system permease protein/mannopine transport system permease protein